MNSLTKDFVSHDPRTFRYKIGRTLASSLAGFFAGVIITSIIWIIGFWYIGQLQRISPSAPVVIESIIRK